MNLIEFKQKHTREQTPAHLRHGQWLMNELAKVRGDIHEKVIVEGADCFYQDSKIKDFWYIVEESWI